MKQDYWREKACLLTGGSAGLGLTIARTLASCGARLAIVARHQDRLEGAASELRAAGASQVVPIAANVVWQEDVDRIVEQVRDEFGELDLLANCAGRSARGRVLETSPDDFQQLLDVNFLAAVRVTQACAPLLFASGGHVVNIGSLASKVAPKYLGAYPASKFALAAYTQQLRMENTEAGLHAMLVCPGPIAGSDVGRYSEHAEGLPAEAAEGGGGAKVSRIDPELLAMKILTACEQRRPELVVPWKAKLLFGLGGFSSRMGDWLLGRFTAQ